MEQKVRTWSWRQMLVLLIGILCFAVIGCEELLDEVWPIITNKAAEKYLTEDPNSTRRLRVLARADEMREDIIVKHRDYLLELRRNIEDDENAFQDAMLIDDRIYESRQWKHYFIGDKTNPLSLASLLGATSLAGLVGYKVKRRGDSTPEEVDVKVAKAVDEEKKKNGSGAAKKKEA